jgi:hypothetical protein
VNRKEGKVEKSEDEKIMEVEARLDHEKIWSAIRIRNGIDDVAITGNLFRMERMNKDTFWVCIYRGKKRTCFYLQGKGVTATLTEDDIGCKDDNEEE